MDINGDGIRDILSGSYSRQEKDMAGLFQVLHGKTGGTFQKAAVLKGTDGEPLIIPADNKDRLTDKICTRPFAVDWNGDGHLDLVVGNFGGSFFWFKGEGKGRFLPKPEAINSGGEPLRIRGAHSDPFMIDWDGDGDLDLLSGSTDGGVQWSENNAGKGKLPEMTPFQPLIKTAKPTEYGHALREGDLTGPTTSTRIWVEDLNGDGKLDLLVGDSVTLTSPAKGLSVEEFQKKSVAWQKAVDKLGQEMASEKADQATREKASQEFSKVYRERSKFLIEDRTGFVWVYLQK